MSNRYNVYDATSTAIAAETGLASKTRAELAEIDLGTYTVVKGTTFTEVDALYAETFVDANYAITGAWP